MKQLLKIQGLHAGYGELGVLKDVALAVKKGEMVALIGPNGAGKSTVIKSLFRLADVSKGKISFKGKSIKGLKTHELIGQGITYVNQGRIIFGHLTVQENLELGVDTLVEADVVQERLDEVYKEFPILKERKNGMAYGLSGGERQQLALGRAIMSKPDLLLLDEPSLGLSPKLQKEMFARVGKLRDQGMGVLMVEQNAKKAIELADRTYLLEDGKVVLQGGKEIIKDKRIKEVYLGGR